MMHMQETLRYHPILYALVRAAARDDLIPLATPQTTKTGETITVIPVSKGQHVILSLAAYNR
jgi:cytochrome P450